MIYDSYMLDSKEYAETELGYVFPVTLAAEITQQYSVGTAYKSPEALEFMVNEARMSGREIPVTLEHPELDANGWAHRATVGKILPSSLYYDRINHKARGQAVIFKGNDWVADTILKSQERGVSIGFESKEVYEKGEFNGQPYDFRQDNIVLDHLAITLDLDPRCPNGVCGFFADTVKRTDPEVTENLIRIPIVQPTGGEIRTIVISPEKGVKALIEIKNGASKVITYLFEKAKWSMENAKAWIAQHKAHGSSADNINPLTEVLKMSEEEKPKEEVEVTTKVEEVEEVPQVETPEEPKTEVTDTEPKADTDCSKKLDSLIAEYEEKLAARDAKIEEVRADFQKKFDAIMEAKKDSTSEEIEDAPKEAAQDSIPATGEKSVKPVSDTVLDKIAEAKSKRLDTYMFKQT